MYSRATTSLMALRLLPLPEAPDLVFGAIAGEENCQLVADGNRLRGELTVCAKVWSAAGYCMVWLLLAGEMRGQFSATTVGMPRLAWRWPSVCLISAPLREGDN